MLDVLKGSTMNKKWGKCSKCGELISKTQKFCSTSCARKFRDHGVSVCRVDNCRSPVDYTKWMILKYCKNHCHYNIDLIAEMYKTHNDPHAGKKAAIKANHTNQVNNLKTKITRLENEVSLLKARNAAYSAKRPLDDFIILDTKGEKLEPGEIKRSKPDVAINNIDKFIEDAKPKFTNQTRYFTTDCP